MLGKVGQRISAGKKIRSRRIELGLQSGDTEHAGYLQRGPHMQVGLPLATPLLSPLVRGERYFCACDP